MSAYTPGTYIPAEEAQRHPKPIIAWNALGQVACFAAPKYDGVRLQVHKYGENIKLFSKGGDDWTKRYPQLLPAILNQLTVDNIVFDGELLNFDYDKGGGYRGQPHPKSTHRPINWSPLISST
jgi:ATP-dependent DNA ligase